MHVQVAVPSSGYYRTWFKCQHAFRNASSLLYKIRPQLLPRWCLLSISLTLWPNCYLILITSDFLLLTFEVSVQMSPCLQIYLHTHEKQNSLLTLSFRRAFFFSFFITLQPPKVTYHFIICFYLLSPSMDCKDLFFSTLFSQPGQCLNMVSTQFTFLRKRKKFSIKL